MATFLFTSDLQIAGVESVSVSGQTAVGIIQSGITATSVKVKLLNGLTVSGNPQLMSDRAAELSGELVTVSSTGMGKLAVTPLGVSSAFGELDLTKKTLGTRTLSSSVHIFERVGSSAVLQITLDDMTQPKVSASNVLYAGTDAAGRVNTLILNDVTGDCYTYGILADKTIVDQLDADIYVTTRSVYVKNSENVDGTTPVVTGSYFLDQKPGGVVLSTDGSKVQKIVMLTEVTGVKRSAFYTRDDKVYLMINGVEYPVSDNVQCYNSLSGTWFKTLNDARVFSDTLKVYYDRTAAEGGKIRVVIAG
jgi:hypothetical protein